MNPLNMTYDKYKQNTGKVIVLSINAVNATAAQIKTYDETYKVRYPTINNGGAIYTSFNQQGVPAGILVCPDKSYIEFFPADVQIALQTVKAPDPDSALVLGTASTDLLAGNWSVAVDAHGSTTDTTGGIVQNGIVKVKFNKANKQYTFTALIAEYVATPEKKPVLKIEYKSNSDWYILAITGGTTTDTSEFDVAASTDWNIKKIRMDSLDVYQLGVLPKNEVVFDVSKLKALIFLAVAQSGAIELEIKELRLYDAAETLIHDFLDVTAKKDVPRLTVSQNAVSFATNKSDRYTISIFNANGRRVTTITDGLFSPGSHTVAYDGSILSKGIYLVELKSSDCKASGKMVISK